jgi:putative transcriptional regulator
MQRRSRIMVRRPAVATEHWRTMAADAITLPPSQPIEDSEDDGMMSVPPEAFRPPLDPEFERLALDQPPPEPFDTEALRRHRTDKARAERHVPLPLPDIAMIRRRMRFTQEEFAKIFGFPVATLRHWEKGDRYPRGAALVLLNVIARHPRAVLQVVSRYRLSLIRLRLPPQPPGA